MVLIEIPCAPVPWKAHGGHGKSSYDPRYEEKEFYKFEIKRQYHHNFPLALAVRIDCTFYMPIPKNANKHERTEMAAGRVHHVKRPDVDNLFKLFGDCIKEIVILDDSYISELHIRKIYSDRPRTIAVIEQL
jgi:Holliday junction resolvase RusA-like endonuclease